MEGTCILEGDGDDYTVTTFKEIVEATYTTSEGGVVEICDSKGKRKLKNHGSDIFWALAKIEDKITPIVAEKILHDFKWLTKEYEGVPKIAMSDVQVGFSFSFELNVIFCKCDKHDIWGYAICSPCDDFDFQTGEDIAKERLFKAEMAHATGLKGKEYEIRGAFDESEKLDTIIAQGVTESEVKAKREYLKREKEERRKKELEIYYAKK